MVLSLIPAGTHHMKDDIHLPGDSHVANPGSVQFRGLIVVQESTLFCKSDAIPGINLNLF